MDDIEETGGKLEWFLSLQEVRVIMNEVRVWLDPCCFGLEGREEKIFFFCCLKLEFCIYFQM